MTLEIEVAMVELTTLAAAARHCLERGEIPDLAPIARGVERLGRLSEAVTSEALAALRLRFVALTDELGQLAEAAATNLARTAAALEASRLHRSAVAAYGRTEREG